MPLDELQGASYNPRVITDEAAAGLGASIDRWGLVQPIVWNKRTRTVVGGHKRIEQLRKLGHKEADVRIVDLNEEEERALNVALNNQHIAGEFTPELQGILGDIETWMPLDSFSELRFDQLWAPSTPSIEHDEKAPPAPPKNVDVRAGDVFICGPHRVVCGDMLDGTNMAEAVDGLVDAIITDPPYAIFGSASGVTSSIADDKMVVPFFRSMWAHFESVLKEFGHAYVCCDWRSYPAIGQAARGSKMQPKNVIVWDKGQAGLGSMWRHCHEFVAFYVHEPPAKSMNAGRKAGHRTVKRSNVIHCDRVRGEERQHNAAKPRALLREVIEASTDAKGRVLDPFGGSGQTLLTCEELGRNCITADVEPAMVALIVKRWEDLTGKKATRKRRE